MTDTPQPTSPAWYVLNYITSHGQTAQKTINRYNNRQNTALELFAPTYVVKEERDGQTRFRDVSLTFHYLFVRGPFSEVKRLCSETNGFSFLINRGATERYAVIPDRQMAGFQNIARAYKNCLPYFPVGDLDLRKGDLVEVVKGDFPGLVGRFIPNPRSKTGNLVLHVCSDFNTIAFNVKATDIRILEFAPDTTRANDQLDAFTPHLLAALRSHRDSQPLPSTLAARLAVFCGRMEVATLNNNKLNARLQALLYVAARILGNSAVATRARERYSKVAGSVTNVWTTALNTLILTIVDGHDIAPLRAIADDLLTREGVSKTQRMILEEYNHYLSIGS